MWYFLKIYAILLTYTPTGYIITFIKRGEQMDKNTNNLENTEENNTSKKLKQRPPEEYKRLLHRLNRLEGQIRGIKGMLEKSEPCSKILVQSSAISAALNAFNKELLSNHIKNCVAQDIKDGKDEVIDELLKTLQKLMK